MLKNKFITRSLCTMFFMAAPLAVAVTPGNAWNSKTIDYETHHNSTNLVEGSYQDNGPWTSYGWPPAANGSYRFLTRFIDPARRGIAFWLVEIPTTGFYKLETSFRASENRTSDADYAVYVNTTTADVENYKSIPVYKVSVSQHGSGVPWVNLGTYCLQKNAISMIVLDGRDDGQSDSTDGGRWTFMGTEYNSKSCGSQGVNMVPINYLLLKPVR